MQFVTENIFLLALYLPSAESALNPEWWGEEIREEDDKD